MFPVITNIYNKKTKGPTIHSHRKTENVFLVLEVFDGCTTGDTAHINTIFKFNDQCVYTEIIEAMKNIDAPTLTRVWQELQYRIDMCRVTRGAHIKLLYLKKNNFFSFPVTVSNSIKVGPLVFLL
jgi:hypothetical protein